MKKKQQQQKKKNDYFTGNLERSNLYLKLFKLVFGSVSLFAAENEQMLKVSTNQETLLTRFVALKAVHLLIVVEIL